MFRLMGKKIITNLRSNKNWAASKTFIIPPQHYLQYVCNIHEYKKDTLKAVGVDFIMYALLTIILYVQWSRIC